MYASNIDIYNVIYTFIEGLGHHFTVKDYACNIKKEVQNLDLISINIIG